MLGASSSVKPTLAIMPTHWHQAFIAAELYSDSWIGIHSESAKGKHFVWSDGSSLLYSNWRMLHPTHNNLDIDQRAGKSSNFDRPNLSRPKENDLHRFKLFKVSK